jgi:hypothetical protein
VFGGVLLFHPGWVVSSALAGLASGFGMGPGVSLPLLTAVTLFTFQSAHCVVGSVIGGGVWMLVVSICGCVVAGFVGKFSAG